MHNFLCFLYSYYLNRNFCKVMLNKYSSLNRHLTSHVAVGKGRKNLDKKYISCV